MKNNGQLNHANRFSHAVRTRTTYWTEGWGRVQKKRILTLAGNRNPARLFNMNNYDDVGTSHMSDNRQMSVSEKRLVDFMSMVTQQYVTS
jgi:hypothetical protein